mgnify:CR=1 FL=1
MIKNLYSITNIYERLINPILKEDKGVDAECLTNLSLKLLAFCSSQKESGIISNYLGKIRMMQAQSRPPGVFLPDPCINWGNRKDTVS